MKPQIKRTFVVVIITLILAASAVTTAFAHGNVDQQNVPPNFNQYTSVSNMVAGQSFVPQGRDIVAVDLYVSYKPPVFGVATTLKVTIRQGPPFCADWHCVLTSETVTLTPGFAGWKHIDLSSPVQVDPTNQYGIQVSSPSNLTRWYYGSDTYAPGMAYCAIKPPWESGFFPNYDGSFVTYRQ